ncbi:hypothetical protein ACOKW7_23355 [Limnospira platensis CENA597]|uniref:hypothetical protein n=1 Tax=Limnospira platensis TaxID=118562 RepID=UPI003DA09C4E
MKRSETQQKVRDGGVGFRYLHPTYSTNGGVKRSETQQTDYRKEAGMGERFNTTGEMRSPWGAARIASFPKPLPIIPDIAF